jgi:hypothetical protein
VKEFVGCTEKLAYVWKPTQPRVPHPPPKKTITFVEFAFKNINLYNRGNEIICRKPCIMNNFTSVIR